MTLPTTPIAEPRRGFPRWLIAVIVAGGLLAVGFCAIAGIGFLSLLGAKVEPTVVTATDGQSQVTVPGTWQTSTELNDEAELQVSNARQEQYLIVLTESRSDLAGIDIETYAEFVRDGLAGSVSSPTVSDPRALTIGGLPAVQYELRGTVDGLSAVYWITAVEGTENYYQVLSWTLASQAEENQPALQQAIESFREIAK